MMAGTLAAGAYTFKGELNQNAPGKAAHDQQVKEKKQQ